MFRIRRIYSVLPLFVHRFYICDSSQLWYKVVLCCQKCYTFRSVCFQTVQASLCQRKQAINSVTSIMATIRMSLIVLIILTLMSLDVSEAFEIRESDYEIHVKNSNGKAFIAYMIEQGDLIVKKKCTCTSWNKCNLKNMIKLSK